MLIMAAADALLQEHLVLIEGKLRSTLAALVLREYGSNFCALQAYLPLLLRSECQVAAHGKPNGSLLVA